MTLLIQELLAHISIGLEADLIPKNGCFCGLKPFFDRVFAELLPQKWYFQATFTNRYMRKQL